MEFATTATSAAVALIGVVLGGWLSTRNQDRSWKREHTRQWRDIRLAAYSEFAAAYSQLVAFALEPTAKITTKPHPRIPGTVMPLFDDEGRRYKERLDAASLGVYLVSESPDTVEASAAVVQSARQIAGARAEYSESDIPIEVIAAHWAAQDAFMSASRRELGLPNVPWEMIYPRGEGSATD